MRSTYMDAAGLEDATVHCLRHSFAKNLVDTGTPLQVVAQLAGHESLQATRRYVTPSEADLRRAVKGVSWER
ncbi:MAG: tyrosine-type recombinase/integrase [Firmicutes bacterium]|nr:tyrosine-type recombinase/integrase [Bacillota bacterium]